MTPGGGVGNGTVVVVLAVAGTAVVVVVGAAGVGGRLKLTAGFGGVGSTTTACELALLATRVAVGWMTRRLTRVAASRPTAVIWVNGRSPGLPVLRFPPS